MDSINKSKKDSILFSVSNFQVCKRWKFFIDEVKPTELILGHRRDLITVFNRKWFHTNDQVNFRNQIIIPNLSMISNFPYSLTNLKRLHIYFVLKQSDLPLLASLTELEQLQIYALEIERNKNASLVLPSVKIISVSEIHAVPMDFEIGSVCLRCSRYEQNIDAPQLKVLGNAFGVESLKFEHPETVSDLHIEVTFSGEYLKQFRNVQIFECESCDRLDRELLTFFPNLKELRLDQRFIESFEKCDVVEHFMNHLIEQRQVLDKQHVKIYFTGTEMIEDGKFVDYGFDLRSRLINLDQVAIN